MEAGPMPDYVSEITNIISSTVKTHWDKYEKPFLLSDISPVLKAHKIDYKSIIADVKLKDFVQQISGKNFFVIHHPIQKAKIGLIPSGVEYSFNIEEPVSTEQQEVHRDFAPQTDRTRALISFLRALSHLEDEELSKIIIPTRTLVRLVSKK